MGVGFFIWDQYNSSRISDIVVALVWVGLVGFALDRLVALLGRIVSRGAAVPFERIFLLNSLLDLYSFRYLDMATAYAGCSTFAVAAEAGTGKTLVGQTYDMPELHENYLTLLRLKPAHGPAQLLFTFAGIIGAAGLNEVGLAVNPHALTRSLSRCGAAPFWSETSGVTV